MLTDSNLPEVDRLQLQDTFRFSCSPELACFNRCCRHKDLLLTPYDILRLKKALNIDSDQFLAGYSLYRLDSKSGFPVITLKMLDRAEAPCPFVGPEGCSIYADRPTACRLFPLGRATAVDKNQNGNPEEFFFLLDIPGCLGFQAEQERSVDEFLKNQELTPYITTNNRMLDLIFHPKRDRTIPLNDRQLQNIIVSCYNLDVFREFVFTPDFLQTLTVSEQTLNLLKRDDMALLNFGFDYLRQVLFR